MLQRIIALVLIAGCSLNAQTVSDAPAGPEGAGSSVIAPIIAPKPPVRREGGINPEDRGVDWAGVFREASRFLAVEHAFRCATEYDTRNAKGQFIGGYANSLTNLHGWADGDPFYVNYVGHPIQGAVAGYIWAQNDRRYRAVEFGKDPMYWKARFRSAAFAWAYSAQFEIGPVSEASIGYVQAYFPQQGFVDHVITPVVGTAWMLAEDSVDKYFIKRLEGKTRNRYARMFLRGGLNPSRSMANVLSGRPPWHRDTRPGILSYDTTAYRDSVIPSGTERAEIAPFELSVASEFRQYFGSSGIGCLGGGATAAYRMAPEWQLVAEVSGCKITGLRHNLSGDSLIYLTGTRWTPSPASRWSPHVQLLVGGNKVSNEEMFPLAKKAIESGAGPIDTQTAIRDHAEYTRQDDANGFAVAAGGGLDVKLNSALAVQVAKLEYTRSWVRPVNGMDYSSGLRFTAGIVLRMGTW